ncbi:DUF4144 domain-containing protein [Pseudoalteromonas xiamenensis]|uniref:DUF4144 family protein n=1 Tax=Pseudoalteromonas xiamenensis TaxID=882626 RepID=UPI0027E3F519|nr:DUF4144 family protein [Pseudoalteromonas xiamenensis]WMN61112.1 DUF4144 domain-containing protein [Pseudoalteromonas xiamenensis]
MSTNSYPLLLISSQEVQLIEDQETFENEVFYIKNNELDNHRIITTDGFNFSLKGDALPALSMAELTCLVQQSLAQEGHCCVGKIMLTNIQEAFALCQPR